MSADAPDPSDRELAAEIAGLRRRIEALERGPRELAIQPMLLANRDRREYHLFYDLFVHADRKKLTAVGPYYGEDFDPAACGVDPERVELRVEGECIPARRVPYGLDGFEPSILWDFEHPRLAEWIAAGPELRVEVGAGEAASTFWLDTTPPPVHELSMALCVHDENRWLPLYLDYYVEVLGIGHVYVYDNRTRDKRALRALLAPYAARGQVTLIPWNFAWRNRKDQKQIGQPPQETHTLARFGRDRWIGFFDTDEFLYVPGNDLRGLLASYDPGEIGAVGFKMRWAMYKGERRFEDIANPLTEMVYAREDAYWQKRWKLFVSPRLVRFMRFHWIQEDRETVHLPEVRYYHYFLRDFRFEEGKGDEGLGAETERDETLRRVWEAHAASRAGSPGSPLVAHVVESLARATRGESKLSPEVLGLDGMIGDPTRHFYNNLAARAGTRLLEIGAWKGASTCAFLFGNQVDATVIDDWSQWGDYRHECSANLERFRGDSRVRLIERDCFSVEPGELGRYDLYLYDGSHGEEDHYRALVRFHPVLADEAIVLVDDWNWRRVRAGTERALAEIPFEVRFRREITVPESPRPADGKIVQDPRSWWNGLACFVLRRR